MRGIRHIVTAAYWAVKIGWVLIIPIGVIGFFAGGWFVLAMYWGLDAWVTDLREDVRAIERTDEGADFKERLTKRVDWSLARTADNRPRVVLHQKHGDQGNVVTSQDLGYVAPRTDVTGMLPMQLQCDDCAARFHPPYPEQCPFCLSRFFSEPSNL